MKTLHLLRHAKSSWDDETLDDHARPLSPRGQRNARAMGRYLSERRVALDRVRCSTARRAVETWELAAGTFQHDVERILEDSLYLADPETLLELIRSEEDRVSSVLLVGHNPGLSELVLALCGGEPTADLRRIATKLPTGAWVEIGFGCSRWAHVGRSGGRLLGFQVPRELG